MPDPSSLDPGLLLSFQAAPAPGQPGLLQMLPMFLAIIAIFYFLVIRPQTKAREQHAELLGGLKKGDTVVTDGGIVGTIHEVQDALVVLEVSKGNRVRFEKESIRGQFGADTAEAS